MRTVEINRGDCWVFAEWFRATCPICLTTIRAGQVHQRHVPPKHEGAK